MLDGPKDVPLYTNLWSEKVGTQFLNKCGPLSFDVSYLPVGSETGAITVSPDKSKLTINTLDTSRFGSTITVTVTGTLPNLLS